MCRRTEKMMSRSDNENARDMHKSFLEKVKYYIWIWRQRTLGRSMVTAEMRFMKYKLLVLKMEKEHESEHAIKEVNHVAFFAELADEPVLEVSKAYKPPKFEDSFNSFPHLMFVGFLNQYFIKEGLCKVFAYAIPGTNIELKDLNTEMTTMRIEEKCNRVLKKMKNLKASITAQKYGFFEKEFKQFLNKETNNISYLRANAIKAIIMSFLRPELAVQTHGAKMKVKCGKRSYMLELYPSRGQRKSEEAVEDGYHNQLDAIMAKFDSIERLLNFDGLQTLPF
jgi:hypothetical protein